MTLRILMIGSTLMVIAACDQESVDESTAVSPPESTAEAVTEAASATLPRTASANGASVFFITPADGATVTSPVEIEFGIAGMEVVRAGDNQPNSGHHHLLIDTDLPDLGMPIPADERHVHFGDGSTETKITLPPGEHTLQMLLGDYVHIPHKPALLSEPIRITVE